MEACGMSIAKRPSNRLALLLIDEAIDEALNIADSGLCSFIARRVSVFTVPLVIPGR